MKYAIQRLNNPKDGRQRRSWTLLLSTTATLCLLVLAACQSRSSSGIERNETQAPIAPTSTVASPAALTPEVTATETLIIESQETPAAAVTPEISGAGELPGKLLFIRENNLWLRHNGVEKQLTTDAIPTEPPYFTRSRLWYSNPQISPDGTKIAYLRNTNSKFRNLIVSDSEGNNAQQLANDVEGGMPIVRWSNDSQKIFYPSTQEGETKIVRSINVATGEEQEHGQFTLMAACGGGSPDVADHISAEENIIGIGGGVQIFDLSPQNDYIVYTTACTGSGLGLLDLSTNQAKELDAEAGGAVISPDGLSIAAISGSNLVIFEASSGKIEKTFPTSELPLVLLWHPDGKTILYSTAALAKTLDFDTGLAFDYIGSAPASYSVNLSSLWALSLDTGKSQKIIDFEAHHLKPIFTADQKVLVAVVENATALFDYITQQNPKENMAQYYPAVNLAEVDLTTLKSTLIASKTQEASYSSK